MPFRFRIFSDLCHIRCKQIGARSSSLIEIDIGFKDIYVECTTGFQTHMGSNWGSLLPLRPSLSEFRGLDLSRSMGLTRSLWVIPPTAYVRAKNVQMSSGCVWGVVNHLKVVKDSSELH
ncbi:hypothetical protein ABKV19_025294 [Rosa sericea]